MKMKNRMILSIAITLPFLLSACQQDATESESPSSTASKKIAPQQNDDAVPNASEHSDTQMSNSRPALGRSNATYSSEPIDFIEEEILAEARINITSSDDDLRMEAVYNLTLDDANDLQLLENVLLTDPNPEVREEVVLHLTEGDPANVVPLLMKALNDSHPSVVIAALDWLSVMDIGDKSAVTTEFKQIAATHYDEEVKEAAEMALEMME
ncbi:HEAT repeat domain-containing protein [Methylotuvimicrobium sp. KM2]|uniref:HEAT repeat domain-containing protein n=1 Tax=Methylotuvimicrobium sp. KM2 TaxID=3133976 RepID=UPI003101772F